MIRTDAAFSERNVYTESIVVHSPIKIKPCFEWLFGQSRKRLQENWWLWTGLNLDLFIEDIVSM
jgi:hypothetical protein